MGDPSSRVADAGPDQITVEELLAHLSDISSASGALIGLDMLIARLPALERDLQDTKVRRVDHQVPRLILIAGGYSEPMGHAEAIEWILGTNAPLGTRELALSTYMRLDSATRHLDRNH